MLLFDILKEFGIPSAEIKSRVTNNQITLNGEVVKSNIDINAEYYLEFDEFIFNMMEYDDLKLQLRVFNRDLFGGNVNEFFNSFILLKVAKGKEYLLVKSDN